MEEENIFEEAFGSLVQILMIENQDVFEVLSKGCIVGCKGIFYRPKEKNYSLDISVICEAWKAYCNQNAIRSNRKLIGDETC